jgi:hypothetical protein
MTASVNTINVFKLQNKVVHKYLQITAMQFVMEANYPTSPNYFKYYVHKLIAIFHIRPALLDIEITH